MGFWKNIMIEAQGRGNWVPDRMESYICAHHYEDVYLNKYIKKNSTKGRCSFCGRETEVCDMYDFMMFVIQRILVYYQDIEDASLYLADGFYDSEDEIISGFKRIGRYVVPDEAEYFESKEEMLNNIGLWSDEKKLDEYVMSQFGTEQWISRDLIAESGGKGLYNAWQNFARLVSTRYRFTFLAQPDIMKIKIGVREGNLLEEIKRYILDSGICVSLPTSSVLYRARRVIVKETTFGFEQLTSPPEECARVNRMSPAGVSMFYASTDKKTAIVECTGDEPYVVVGEFKPKRSLKIIDFTQLPRLSFWMDNYEQNYFLTLFHNELTKPLSADDKHQIAYIPSQVFTEYLRYLFKDADGNRVDGLAYRSRKTGKRNVVLFCNQQESRRLVELMSVGASRGVRCRVKGV